MTIRRSRISSAQLAFAFKNDPEFLVRTFEKSTGTAVMLVLTDNSTSMLSVRKKGALFYVRLHQMFLGADEDILGEIASFIKHGRGRMTRFRAFVKTMSEAIRKKPRRSFQVKTLGKYNDLHSIFERLNHEYFEGKLSSVITWGRGSPGFGKAVRKRTLGSYSRQTDTIRINPVLDKKAVPRYYIEFVVYHEMLHAAIGIQEKAGRRFVHTREFRERERLFREYEKAIRWEKSKQ